MFYISIIIALFVCLNRIGIGPLAHDFCYSPRTAPRKEVNFQSVQRVSGEESELLFRYIQIYSHVSNYSSYIIKRSPSLFEILKCNWMMFSVQCTNANKFWVLKISNFPVHQWISSLVAKAQKKRKRRNVRISADSESDDWNLRLSNWSEIIAILVTKAQL